MRGHPGSIITDDDSLHLAINYRAYRIPLRLFLAGSPTGIAHSRLHRLLIIRVSCYEAQEDA